MTVHKKIALVAFSVVVIAVGTVGVSLADEPQRHVVGESEIQARIDQQINQADADRQAIQVMLQRTEVRQVAGSAGLDLERASAAVSVLSGPTLEKLAAQAREVNAGLVGGDGTIVLSATAVIIILLILILVLN
ncbi:MAG: PA2779 family protein [Candidatus Eisenbacteria bacterium]